jgi:internalin A
MTIEIIREIEKEIGKELNEITIEEVSSGINNGYVLDKRGNIIGLNLDEFNIKNLKLISNLTQLTHLSLFYNKIKKIKGLNKLTKLQQLYLSSNQISRIENIEALTNLQELDLSDNQIVRIENIETLTNLEQLDLGDNKISCIENIKFLSKLKRLDLSDNQIKKIQKKDILNLKLEIIYTDDSIWYLENQINFYGNPIETPPIEIVKQGNEAIIAYFESIEEESIPLNEVKILFIGHGGSGKTSLKKAIKNEPFDINEGTTKGIEHDEIVNIESKKIGNIKAYLWDFGGQEKMHPTHKFFFSKRSIYILVLDARSEDKANYWLDLIKIYGENSKILVVFNKMDQNPSYNLDEAKLKYLYPNIIGFYKTSCPDNYREKYDFKQFKEKLEETVRKTELVSTRFSPKWAKLKDDISKENKEFLSLTEYQQVCRKYGIKKDTHKMTLLGYLNDLGLVLYYPDDNLQYTEVINPKWITAAVYKLFYDDKIIKNKGRFKKKYLWQVLENIKEYDYPEEHRPFILYLMEKFHICLKLKEKDYLILDLLPNETRKPPFCIEAALKLRLKYNLTIPKNVINDLMAGLYHYLYEDYIWKTGIVLYKENGENYALIEIDEPNKIIDIFVFGGDEPRAFLSYIRNVFDGLIRDIPNLKKKELLPLPEKNDYGEYEYVSYKELIGLERMRKAVYVSGILGKEFSLKELLDGIEDRRVREKDYDPRLPDIHIHTKTEVNPEININIQLINNINLLQSSFNDLKDELIAQNEDQDKDLEKELLDVQKRIEKIENAKNKNDIIKTGALGKLKRFIEDLGDENSKIGKTLKGVRKGYEIASDLAEKYNQIADFCGMP